MAPFLLAEVACLRQYKVGLHFVLYKVYTVHFVLGASRPPRVKNIVFDTLKNHPMIFLKACKEHAFNPNTSYVSGVKRGHRPLFTGGGSSPPPVQSEYPTLY